MTFGSSGVSRHDPTRVEQSIPNSDERAGNSNSAAGEKSTLSNARSIPTASIRHPSPFSVRLIPAAGISLFARGFRTLMTAGLEGLWFALSTRGTWEEKKITDPDF